MIAGIIGQTRSYTTGQRGPLLLTDYRRGVCLHSANLVPAQLISHSYAHMLHSPKIRPSPLIGGVTPRAANIRNFQVPQRIPCTNTEARSPGGEIGEFTTSIERIHAQAQTAIIEIRFRETQVKILPDGTDVECCSETLAAAKQVLLGNRNVKEYLIPATETGADTEGASRTFLDINLKVHRIGAAGLFSR